MTDLFGDFSRALFGTGSVPPQSVARKVLGINVTRPLVEEGIRAAFRFRVKLLRPDINDAAADALRVKDLGVDAPILGGEVRFDSGSKEEQLSELLWARDDLLSRVPKPPVTGDGGGSHASYSPSPSVTEEWEREREREEERKREQRRKWKQDYRRRRAKRAPSALRCRECHAVIDRDEVAVVGSRWQDRFHLNPYTTDGWWGAGPRHEGCIEQPIEVVPWLQRLADEKAVLLETRCEVCNRLVRPPRWLDGRRRVYYCSKGCAGGADRLANRIERTDVACAVCGDMFPPARADARYCSGACRQDAYRKRRGGFLS